MRDITFDILTTEAERTEHEKALYKSYMAKNDAGWVANNYLVLDGNRLRSRFSYEDQIVFAVKRDGQVIAAATLMTNPNNPLMLEAMGFTIPKDEKFCEGINLYAPDDLPGEQVFEIFGEFFAYMIARLRERGFDCVYSTCERHMKAFYSLMGFEIRDKIRTKNGMQYLTRCGMK